MATDRGFLDLRPLTADLAGTFLAGGGLDQVAQAVCRGDLPSFVPGPDARIGAPIARPGAVYAMGMNYAAYAAKTGTEPAEDPILFLKPPSMVVGPFEDVTIPPGRSRRTDTEVELGVVVGRRASHLDLPHDALAHIAGFVVADDLSEWEWQLAESGGQRDGETPAGFCPVGPWLVTPDEVSWLDLRLCSWVNGEPRQDSSTGDLIYGVEVLVWYLSQYRVLEPGDLILTGTPEGVALTGQFPRLQAGDVVECEIEGLGRQRQRCVAA